MDKKRKQFSQFQFDATWQPMLQLFNRLRLHLVLLLLGPVGSFASLLVPTLNSIGLLNIQLLLRFKSLYYPKLLCQRKEAGKVESSKQIGK